jgi:hypothetical protein
MHIFEDTYQLYLEELSHIDIAARADLLGVNSEKDGLRIPLYGREYLVSKGGIADPDGRQVTPAIRVVLCKYVLTCPAELPVLSDRLVTYREFKDAGPLISYFTTNTNKFSRRPSPAMSPPCGRDLCSLRGNQTSETYDLR